MLTQLRLQAARLQRACASTPRLASAPADADRAPVTFGWWLYANERFTGQCHVETLYRLNRICERLDGHSDVVVLEASEHCNQPTEKLREMLRLQQDRLLPRAPEGTKWIGPQLVHGARCSVIETRTGAGKYAGVNGRPASAQERLAAAQVLASKILQTRVSA